jgi:hypothetical protein
MISSFLLPFALGVGLQSTFLDTHSVLEVILIVSPAVNYLYVIQVRVTFINIIHSIVSGWLNAGIGERLEEDLLGGCVSMVAHF